MDRKFSIVEFEQKYTDQVKDVVGSILKELTVIPEDCVFDDDDMDHIADLYRGRGRFWVALDGHGAVIGTVGIENKEGTVTKLRRMFVRPMYRGTGVGQELFEHAKAFAKMQGFTELELNTHLLMKRAHAFYEKNGFVKIGQTADSYQYILSLEDR